MTREVAQKDPNNFGFPGFVKGTMQDVTALANGVSQVFGDDGFEQSVTDAQRHLFNSDVSADVGVELLPSFYDPSLPQLQTLSDLLVFQAAAALAGQSGRSVSDKDVRMFKNIVGDPSSLFTSQAKFLSKLQMVENILGMQRGVVDNTMGGDVTGGANPTPPPGGETVDTGGYSQEDLEFTAQKYGMSIEEVKAKLGGQ
jgi:hypothetical protein